MRSHQSLVNNASYPPPHPPAFSPSPSFPSCIAAMPCAKQNPCTPHLFFLHFNLYKCIICLESIECLTSYICRAYAKTSAFSNHIAVFLQPRGQHLRFLVFILDGNVITVGPTFFFPRCALVLPPLVSFFSAGVILAAGPSIKFGRR